MQRSPRSMTALLTAVAALMALSPASANDYAFANDPASFQTMLEKNDKPTPPVAPAVHPDLAYLRALPFLGKSLRPYHPIWIGRLRDSGKRARKSVPSRAHR
jgi:hypothetical protein